MVNILLLKAKILLELNKFAESKTSFDDYFAMHDPKKDLPLDPLAYNGRGICQRALNLLGPALSDLSRSAAMLPDDTQSRVRRAMLLVSAWKDLAQDDFTMVLASKDAEPGQIIEALTMRGYLRATQNNIKGAIEDALKDEALKAKYIKLINDKIVDRAVKMLMKNSGLEDYNQAKKLLLEHGSVKKALDIFNSGK